MLFVDLQKSHSLCCMSGSLICDNNWVNVHKTLQKQLQIDRDSFILVGTATYYSRNIGICVSVPGDCFNPSQEIFF